MSKQHGPINSSAIFTPVYFDGFKVCVREPHTFAHSFHIYALTAQRKIAVVFLHTAGARTAVFHADCFRFLLRHNIFYFSIRPNFFLVSFLDEVQGCIDIGIIFRKP